MVILIKKTSTISTDWFFMNSFNYFQPNNFYKSLIQVLQMASKLMIKMLQPTTATTTWTTTILSRIPVLLQIPSPLPNIWWTQSVAFQPMPACRIQPKDYQKVGRPTLFILCKQMIFMVKDRLLPLCYFSYLVAFICT